MSPRLPLLLSLLIMATASVPTHADNAAPATTNTNTAPAPAPPGPPLPAQLRFFGTWDRRQPDRAITVNTGSYIRAQFTGSSISAKFDTSLNKLPGVPTLTWQIEGQAGWSEAEIAPEMKLGDRLAPGPHTICLQVRGLDEHLSRWKAPLVSSVTFLGFDLAPDGKLLNPLPEWDHPKLKMEFRGDSITEGVLVGGPGGKPAWSWQTNARDNYVGVTARLLGAEYRQVGFGATGIAHGGSGGAAGAIPAFPFFYDGCPRDDWQPDVVVINQGTNDLNMKPEQYLPLYEKYLAMIRQAYPNAKIAALRPFGGFQGDTIKQAVDAARAGGDTQVYFIDSTGWYPPPCPLHPGAGLSLGLGQYLAAALKAQGLISISSMGDKD